MQYEVRLTAQAMEQIREAVSYISHTLHEPEIANRFADSLQIHAGKISADRGRTVADLWHSQDVI